MFLKFTSDVDESMVGVCLLCSYSCTKISVSQKLPRKNCLSLGRSKENEEVGQKNLFPSFLSFAFVALELMLTHTYG